MARLAGIEVPSRFTLTPALLSLVRSLRSQGEGSITEGIDQAPFSLEGRRVGDEGRTCLDDTTPDRTTFPQHGSETGSLQQIFSTDLNA